MNSLVLKFPSPTRYLGSPSFLRKVQTDLVINSFTVSFICICNRSHGWKTKTQVFSGFLQETIARPSRILSTRQCLAYLLCARHCSNPEDTEVTCPSVIQSQLRNRISGQQRPNVRLWITSFVERTTSNLCQINIQGIVSLAHNRAYWIFGERIGMIASPTISGVWYWKRQLGCG